MPTSVENIMRQLKDRKISRETALRLLKEHSVKEKKTIDIPKSILLAEPRWWHITHNRQTEKLNAKVNINRLFYAGFNFGDNFSAPELGLSAAQCTYLGVQSLPKDLSDTNCLPIAQTYMEIGEVLLVEIQRLLRLQRGQPLYLCMVLAERAETCIYFRLSALFQSLQLENSNFSAHILILPENTDAKQLRHILSMPAPPQFDVLRYRDNQWQYFGLQKISDSRSENLSAVRANLPLIPLKQNGCYLITGGSGGIGRLLCREILEQADARVILVGRSQAPALDTQQREWQEKSAGQVAYYQADISNEDDIAGLFRHIANNYGNINGIIHCAGLCLDSYFVNQTVEEWHRVAAPKVIGLSLLDYYSREVDLDFIWLFSSVAGLRGNIGQADYAAANGFMDGFAAYRNGLCDKGLRKGQTLSINWPLWRDGGMKIDRDTEEEIYQRSGATALISDEAFAQLYLLSAQVTSQGLIVSGDQEKLDDYFLTRDTKQTLTKTNAVAGGIVDTSLSPSENNLPEDLLNATRQKLRQLFAATVKRSPDYIDIDEPLESYGIDSLMITRLNNALGKVFFVADGHSVLSKTLFYEYQTLDAIAHYFIQHFPRACQHWVGASENRDAILKPLPEAPGKRQKEAYPNHERSISSDENIAIIGMSGKYPGAKNLDEFWQNLVDGRDCVSDIPKERWSLDAFYLGDRQRAVHEGKSYCKWGGFIDEFADFDPLFFNISPKEASTIDPQERLFLQVSWTVFEDAGYSRRRLAEQHHGRVGIYAAVTKTGFNLHRTAIDHRSEGGFSGGGVALAQTSFSSMANRVSYYLNLNGPSMPIDTMCSSSLTAIHQACSHLRDNECEMAMVGAVNLYLHPDNYVALCAHQMLSESGRCKSFSSAADGFVPGEGVGCILLKPMDKAVEEGDRIYAQICASSINHGGKTNGYTVPNPNSQRDLICHALSQAGLYANDISYIEAHGTGTEQGDPIEITGLTQAFTLRRCEHEPFGTCAIGSVKSNIGHLEAAAGMAALCKVVLQLQHRQLVPSLHADVVNPNIDLARTPFRIQRELSPWECGERRRIAGISSFGAGGANAHVIVEEYIAPQRPISKDNNCAFLFPVSAKNRPALTRQLEKLLAFINAQQCPTANLLADMAYTLQVGREAMSCRCGFIATTAADLATQMKTLLKCISNGEYADIYETSSVGQPANTALPTSVSGEDSYGASLANADLSALLELWQSGQSCDWSALYQAPYYRRQGITPKIMGLPTYAFAQKYFWLNTGAQAAATKEVGSLAILMASAIDEQPQMLAAIEQQREDFQSDLEHLMEKLLFAQLHSLGCFEKNTISHQCIDVSYHNWFRSSVHHLCERGYLSPQGALLRGDNICLADCWNEWVQAKINWRIWPGNLAHANLVETTLRALPKILTGQIKATQVMFPQSSMSLVEGVYKHNVVSDFYNIVLAKKVLAYIEYRRAHDPQTKIRIFEIGAGTGGTSAVVFDYLQPLSEAVAEYVYSDISKAFLQHAKANYSQLAPYLTYRLYDVEKGLDRQSAIRGQYDLVIASNVLHATANISNTLINTRELLKSQGVLILNEMSQFTLYTHLTFGLLEGWWKHNDAEVRIPACPALSPESWQTCLKSNGFSTVAFPTEQAQRWGQQIIIACHNGQIIDDSSAQSVVVSHRLTSTPDTESVPTVLTPIQMDLTERTDTVSAISRDEIAHVVISALCQCLDMEPEEINANENFSEYGLDSILATQFVHAINRQLSGNLAITELFDYSTVNNLCQFLAAEKNARPYTITPPRHPVDIVNNVRQYPAADSTDIAVVGMSGRFADADSVDELWQRLIEGEELVQDVYRWDMSEYQRQYAKDGRHFTTQSGLLNNIDQFDSLFFMISGFEAICMDPQQRIFLQEAWHTLENAGHSGRAMEDKKVGIFVGCSAGDYQELFPSQAPAQAFWGNTSSLIPARISYYLNLKGPAIAIDTACSSSLVATHMACQSLRSSECDMALAGGVFVQSSPRFFLSANQANMLSPSGKCYAFDERADGMVPGEAAAAILLRPLADAITDRDQIYGVICGSGTNQDGTTNGITAPSANSQQRLQNEVYQHFNIDPNDIGLVEAHGTGTVLGDPIEFAALTKSFNSSSIDSGVTTGSAHCALSSIKANIGHTTTAAGICGLVKALLCLRHRQIPPAANYVQHNPDIALEDSPFYINRKLVDWVSPEGKARMAAVSSFGFSGTNAHVVVREYLSKPTEISVPAKDDKSTLIVLSARTREQLISKVGQLSKWMEARCRKPSGERQTDAELGRLLDNISFTLLVGRRHFEHRLAFVAASYFECIEHLHSCTVDTVPGKSGAVFFGALEENTIRSMEQAQRSAQKTLPSTDCSLSSLNVIAEQFSKGHDFDFSPLFESGHYRRISLPHYPFSQTRFWISEPTIKMYHSPAERHLPADSQPLLGSDEALLSPVEMLAQQQRYVADLPPVMPLKEQAPTIELAPLKAVYSSRQTTPQTTPQTTSNIASGVDIDGEIAVLRLDEYATTTEFLTQLNTLSQRQELKVVVVIIEGRSNNLTNLSTAQQQTLYCGLIDYPLPITVLLDGSITGLQWCLAMACDFIACSSRAHIFTGLGSACSLQLPLTMHRFGYYQALTLLCRVQSINADELVQICPGILPFSGETSQLSLNKLLGFNKEMAAAPRLALSELKRHMQRALRVQCSRDHNITGDLSTKMCTNEVISPATSFGECISLENLDSIARLELKSGLSLIDDFAHCLEHLTSRSDIKAILLSGIVFEQKVSSTITREQWRSLRRQIYSAPFLVIATLPFSVSNDALLTALVADIIILAEEANYDYNSSALQSSPTQTLTNCVDEYLFTRQFGEYFGREFWYSGQCYKGKTLKSRCPGLPVVASRKVNDLGLNYARDIACLPSMQLRQIKAAIRESRNNERRQWIEAVASITDELQVSSLETVELPAIDKHVVDFVPYDDGIVLITLNEKQSKNCFTDAMMDNLSKIFDYLAQAERHKVVVLSGYDSYFCCGGTREGLISLQKGETSFTDRKIYGLPLQCPLPVIAAVGGHAIGAGWSMAMHADMIVLSEHSIYVSNYLSYGFTPGAGATQVFPEVLGDYLAREVLFGAAEYRGEALAARGIGIEIKPPKQVVAQAMKMAQGMAVHSREALVRAKQLMRHCARQNIVDTYRRELTMHASTFVGSKLVLDKIEEHFAKLGDQSQRDDDISPQSATPCSSSSSLSGAIDSAEVQRSLAQMLATELCLDIDSVAKNVPFLELGLDSILALTWVRQINQLYDLGITATKVYQHPTLIELSEFISDAVSVNDKPCQRHTSTQQVAQLAEDTVKNNVEKTVSSNTEPASQSDDGLPSLSDVKNSLSQSLAEELFIDKERLDGNIQFLELGLDSILALTWVRKINRLYPVNLVATTVYKHPTIDSLAAYIHIEMATAHPMPTESINTAKDDSSNNSDLYRAKLDGSDSDIFEASVKSTIAPPASADNTVMIDNQRFNDIDFATENKLLSASKIEEKICPIAVIGMAGKYPMAEDNDAFWRNIKNKVDCVSEVTPDRWDNKVYYDPDPQAPGKTYCRHMGMLDNIDKFDPLLFKISPREAELMDPQQRLFLQACWHSIEDAGINAEELSGSKCGVFASSGPSGYMDLVEHTNAYSLIGGAGSILSARIAYLLNLRGPCLSIDTACSSSLVAITQACNSLLLGDSDIALAGGVSLLIQPTMHIETSKVGMLSTNGRCFTFDQRANGFVPGEGLGVLLLKRLDDAERDGDPIHVLIRAWGVNQDGKTNGITAPNPEAQTRLQQEIYQRFNLNPESIQLVEAHGTGTKLGDPIEVEGLIDAFKPYTKQQNFCALGSVKSNVGHLLAAAGVASLTKVVLAIKHEILPPTMHLEKMNELIQLDSTPFYINTGAKSWPKPAGGPRRAAVSAFGYSGTNAHVIVDQYLPETVDYPPMQTREPVAIVISANSDAALKNNIANILTFISHWQAPKALASLGFTLQTGRVAMPYRFAAVVNSNEELISALKIRLEQTFDRDAQVIKAQQAHIAFFDNDEEGRALIDEWLQNNLVEKLAPLWQNGLDIQWRRLAANNLKDALPRALPRIHLPGYAFAKESYWVPGLLPGQRVEKTMEKNTLTSPNNNLHPLLHKNNSTIEEQRYSSHFQGHEAFIRDEQLYAEVDSNGLMPGLFYLEMARAAGACSLSTEVGGLKNIVWGQPYCFNVQEVGGHRERGQSSDLLNVSVFQDDSGYFYDISSGAYGVNKPGEVVHTVGEIMLKSHLPSDAQQVDINALQARLRCVALEYPAALTEDTFDDFIRCNQLLNHQLPYVNGEVINGSSEDKIELLVCLQLPEENENRQRDVLFEPVFISSAWKLLVFYYIFIKHQNNLVEEDLLSLARAHMPSSLGSIVLEKPLPRTVLVHLEQNIETSSQTNNFDMRFYDQDGNICVKLAQLLVAPITRLPSISA